MACERAVVHVEEVANAISDTVAEAERMAGVRVTGATINVNGAHTWPDITRGRCY